MSLVGNIKGAAGAQGIQGPQGDAGAAGAAGADGATWHNGTVNPSAATGALLTELTAAKTGDYYLDTATGNVYKKTQAAGTAWAD